MEDWHKAKRIEALMSPDEVYKSLGDIVQRMTKRDDQGELSPCHGAPTYNGPYAEDPLCCVCHRSVTYKPAS